VTIAPDRLTTARTVGLRIQVSDLSDFQAYYADPLVMRTLSADGLPWPARESARLFKRHMRHWSEHGFGTWVFRDGDSGRFVGRAGLRVVDVTADSDVEVFYGIASDLWGQGLGTEVAREVIRVAFDDLRWSEVVGFTLPSNLPSRRILERAGFERDGDITHAGLRHLFYRLARTPDS